MLKKENQEENQGPFYKIYKGVYVIPNDVQHVSIEPTDDSCCYAVCVHLENKPVIKIFCNSHSRAGQIADVVVKAINKHFKKLVPDSGTFEWAMIQLKNGRLIKRLFWNSFLYIETATRELYLNVEGENIAFGLDFEDLHATDWIVINEGV